MKRPAILVTGLVLCAIYFLPQLSLEKIKIVFFEIDGTHLKLTANLVGFALLVVDVLLVISYLEEWGGQETRRMPDTDKGRVRSGWEPHRDQAIVAQIMRKHRVFVARKIMLDFFPAAVIALVSVLFLWHFTTGR